MNITIGIVIFYLAIALILKVFNFTTFILVFAVCLATIYCAWRIERKEKLRQNKLRHRQLVRHVMWDESSIPRSRKYKFDKP